MLNTLAIYTHAFNEVKVKATDDIAEMLHLNEKYRRQAWFVPIWPKFDQSLKPDIRITSQITYTAIWEVI